MRAAGKKNSIILDAIYNTFIEFVKLDDLLWV